MIQVPRQPHLRGICVSRRHAEPIAGMGFPFRNHVRQMEGFAPRFHSTGRYPSMTVNSPYGVSTFPMPVMRRGRRSQHASDKRCGSPQRVIGSGPESFAGVLEGHHWSDLLPGVLCQSVVSSALGQISISSITESASRSMRPSWFSQRLSHGRGEPLGAWRWWCRSYPEFNWCGRSMVMS